MSVLVVGTDCAPVHELATALDATVLAVPTVTVPSGADATDWAWVEALERWRTAAVEGPTASSVVAAWTPDLGPATTTEDLSLDGWMARHEVPFARWFAAIGVAAARCGDGGAMVAVVEQTAPLDCAARAAETALADAVDALARSLARSEGPRGVRVNTVTTPARLTSGPVVAPPPPHDRFPGTIATDVAGAVRALLGPDAVAITAATVHADGGRTGR